MGLLGPMFGTTFSAVVGLGLGLLGCGWGSWSQTDLHIAEAYNQIPPMGFSKRPEDAQKNQDYYNAMRNQVVIDDHKRRYSTPAKATEVFEDWRSCAECKKVTKAVLRRSPATWCLFLQQYIYPPEVRPEVLDVPHTGEWFTARRLESTDNLEVVKYRAKNDGDGVQSTIHLWENITCANDATYERLCTDKPGYPLHDACTWPTSYSDEEFEKPERCDTWKNREAALNHFLLTAEAKCLRSDYETHLAYDYEPRGKTWEEWFEWCADGHRVRAIDAWHVCKLRYQSELDYHRADCDRGHAVCSKSPYTWGLDTAALVFGMFGVVGFFLAGLVHNEKVRTLVHWTAWFFNLQSLVFYIACLTTYAVFVYKLNRPRMEYEFMMSETNYLYKNGTYATKGWYTDQLRKQMVWVPEAKIGEDYVLDNYLHHRYEYDWSPYYFSRGYMVTVCAAFWVALSMIMSSVMLCCYTNKPPQYSATMKTAPPDV